MSYPKNKLLQSKENLGCFSISSDSLPPYKEKRELFRAQTTPTKGAKRNNCSAWCKFY